MDGVKRALAILIVFLTAFAMPAQAQFTGDPMGMGQFTGQYPGTGEMQQGQSVPYGYQGTGEMQQMQSMMYGYPGMGGMQPWQGMPYGYPGMGGMQPWQGMPYGYPGGMQQGMGMSYGYPGMGGMQVRQSDPYVVITRLYPGSRSDKDLMATMEGIPQISLFTAAVKASGYSEKLKGEGNYLIFAPLDRSIQRDMSVSNAQSLLANPSLVKGLIENCIAQQPPGERNMTALNGKDVNVLRLKSGLTANGADVKTIIGTSNGLIIVTDGAVGT